MLHMVQNGIGNAAAYNGSLYVVQDDKIRRLSPIECERLMGFPDDYKIVVSKAQAYKQSGNSIVVDVLIAILNNIYGGKDGKKCFK